MTRRRANGGRCVLRIDAGRLDESNDHCVDLGVDERNELGTTNPPWELQREEQTSRRAVDRTTEQLAPLASCDHSTEVSGCFVQS